MGANANIRDIYFRDANNGVLVKMAVKYITPQQVKTQLQAG